MDVCCAYRIGCSLTRVEHACDQSEPRSNGRLANTKEESCYHESRKVVGGSMTHENGTPQEAVQRWSVSAWSVLEWKTHTVTARYFPVGNRTMKYELGQLHAR